MSAMVLLLLVLSVTVHVFAVTYVYYPHPRATNKGNNIKYDKQMGGEAPHDNADIFLYPKPYGLINYGYVPQPGSSEPIQYNLHEGSGRLAQRIPIYLLSANNY